jgi:heterodisulfide reductase subunit B
MENNDAGEARIKYGESTPFETIGTNTENTAKIAGKEHTGLQIFIPCAKCGTKFYTEFIIGKKSEDYICDKCSQTNTDS